MSGLNKSPLHGFSNPFDSDDELDSRETLKNSVGTSSQPSIIKSDSSPNPFDDDAKSTKSSSAARNRYKNEFRDTGGLENQTVQELENYAVYKAEETTEAVDSCLKIAEDIREDATKTLVTLHQQGEQITRTHMVAADIDGDLSRGEKLLGTLGGIFSKTWKPKTNHPITGPIIIRDDPVKRKSNHLEQREKLGLTSGSREQSNSRAPTPGPTNVLQKVEVEKAKQDDGLSNISNILGELKDMAIDMGSEIDGQRKALDRVEDDVEELNFRVQGARRRTRRLLGK